MMKDDKISIYIEVGDNLKEVLIKALQTAYASNESISDIFKGIDLKGIAEVASKNEIDKEAIRQRTPR